MLFFFPLKLLFINCSFFFRSLFKRHFFVLCVCRAEFFSKARDTIWIEHFPLTKTNYFVIYFFFLLIPLADNEKHHSQTQTERSRRELNKEGKKRNKNEMGKTRGKDEEGKNRERKKSDRKKNCPRCVKKRERKITKKRGNKKITS